MGKTLRISFINAKSRLEVKPPYRGVNNGDRGMWLTLVSEFFMVKLNFTYNLFLSTGKDGGFVGGGGSGIPLPNGTWIGTVGDVISGKADIGIIAVNTDERNRQVSFTNSFYDHVYLHFLTNKGVQIFSPATLLWSFDHLMWTCIGSSTLGAFLVFRLIMNGMNILEMNTNGRMSFARRGQVSQENWGLRHQIWFVITTYLDQDCVLPTCTPLRCFVALWLFFALIVTTVYRSKMVSLLAFPVMEEIPHTFKDLVESDYTVGCINPQDAVLSMLARSKDPVYVKLLNNLEIINKNRPKCLEQSIDNQYACVALSSETRYLQYANLSDSDIRKLVQSQENTFVVFLGLHFESGSIYTDAFDRLLSWARPFHLADVWEEFDMVYNVRLQKRDWWLATNQTEKLERSNVIDNDNLTLKHISGAFYALLASLIVSFAVFIQELVGYCLMALIECKMITLIRNMIYGFGLFR
ncbi:glutamate receptor ionotropic, delta-2-like [Folsomia candida]|uniref:glutamate receptor ionotropic, delta-2-like n=1 Tax=Folsomia candida TaxID=158441 RepID=UPI001605085A|nr:glutamate receptor ionotropic, delta-2-like [Folsomia candida]